MINIFFKRYQPKAISPVLQNNIMGKPSTGLYIKIIDIVIRR
jgi:hypothetical protein